MTRNYKQLIIMNISAGHSYSKNVSVSTLRAQKSVLQCTVNQYCSHADVCWSRGAMVVREGKMCNFSFHSTFIYSFCLLHPNQSALLLVYMLMFDVYMYMLFICFVDIVQQCLHMYILKKKNWTRYSSTVSICIFSK